MSAFLRVALGIVAGLLMLAAVGLLARVVDGAGLAVMVPGHLVVLSAPLLLTVATVLLLGSVVLGLLALRPVA